MKSIYRGVVFGGFACFYVGGETFYEKIQGEKPEKVQSYQSEYLKQIQLT